jgi:hypothetical protein
MFANCCVNQSCCLTAGVRPNPLVVSIVTSVTLFLLVKPSLTTSNSTTAQPMMLVDSTGALRLTPASDRDVFVFNDISLIKPLTE